MRSVVVVLPASMCAMMPKLRSLLRSVSTSCATEVFPLFRLRNCCCQFAIAVVSLRPMPATSTAAGRRISPAVVRECPVRLGHLVGVLASLHRGTQPVARVQNLVGQSFDHGLLPALPRKAHQPAKRQRGG